MGEPIALSPHPVPADHHLQRYRTLARALDARFRIPGTPLRFGWDAILGLVPGVGDAAGGLLGGYGLYAGFKVGAPPVILARMLLNLAVDLIGGAVPLVGDLFDFGWRGNLRNLALLERWLERPHQTRRRSRALLLGLLLTILALSAGVVWLALRLARRLVIP
jgi:hypothetical protein